MKQNMVLMVEPCWAVDTGVLVLHRVHSVRRPYRSHICSLWRIDQRRLSLAAEELQGGCCGNWY